MPSKHGLLCFLDLKDTNSSGSVCICAHALSLDLNCVPTRIPVSHTHFDGEAVYGARVATRKNEDERERERERKFY
jgi:hypothetical protein